MHASSGVCALHSLMTLGYSIFHFFTLRSQFVSFFMVTAYDTLHTVQYYCSLNLRKVLQEIVTVMHCMLCHLMGITNEVPSIGRKQMP